MSATTNDLKKKLGEGMSWPHPHCFVCGPENKKGLGLDFVLRDDGGVEAEITCGREYEGYPGMVHGGIISSLLDGAMTNCMFAHGHTAVTAELKIRFRNPVATDQPVKVRAWIDQASDHLHLLKAELIQDGQIKSLGTGKFVRNAELELPKDIGE
jgi:uncharacterized protein (TIGR00369 family)